MAHKASISKVENGANKSSISNLENSANKTSISKVESGANKASISNLENGAKDDRIVTMSEMLTTKDDKQERKQQRRKHCQQTVQQLQESNDLYLDNSITQAEDERTTMAKNDNKNEKRLAINAAHAKQNKPRIGIVQKSRNTAYALGSALKQTIKRITKDKHVSFAKQHTVQQYESKVGPCVMVEYDSGAEGDYIIEKDQHNVGLPIL